MGTAGDNTRTTGRCTDEKTALLRVEDLTGLDGGDGVENDDDTLVEPAGETEGREVVHHLDAAERLHGERAGRDDKIIDGDLAGNGEVGAAEGLEERENLVLGQRREEEPGGGGDEGDQAVGTLLERSVLGGAERNTHDLALAEDDGASAVEMLTNLLKESRARVAEVDNVAVSILLELTAYVVDQSIL